MNLKISREGEGNDGSIHHERDIESPSNSLIISFFESIDSSMNFIGSSSNSTSSSDYCSNSMMHKEEGGNDNCLDD